MACCIIIAKVKPGRAEAIRAYGKSIEKLIAENPYALAPLRLHYLRWVLFDDDTRFMYLGIFDTEFDKYVEDAGMLFKQAGRDPGVTDLPQMPGVVQRLE